MLDGYEGWVHAGYCVEVDDARAEAWRREATGWSLGAAVRLGEGPAVRLPLRARVALEGETVRLPDGRRGHGGRGHPRLRGRSGAGRARQAARALGARVLRGLAVRVGRGDPVRRGLLRAWCRPPSSPAASRCRATRPSRRGCGAPVALDAHPAGRPAVLPRRHGRADHPRRLRRRGGHAGALDDRRAAGWCRSPGCRAAGPRRSASGSSP